MASFDLGRATVRAVVTIAASLPFVLLSALPGGAAGTAWIAKTDPIRIMALGDSITAGVGARGVDVGGGGYRGELENLLDAAGYRYEMIGSRSDYSNGVRAPAHEGWPGYVVRSLPSDPGHELLGPVTANAIDAYDPDVILLMAGTNDLLRLERHSAGYTVDGIVGGMDALLGQIFFDKPRVHVILAGVVSSPDISGCTVERFDGVATPACPADGSASLATLVEKYRKLGFDIVLAPRMDAAVPRDRQHFPDGIHPSGDGGYAAVARVWMSAIAAETRQPESGNVAVTKP
jgi:lysophospholipase L1-like esterase